MTPVCYQCGRPAVYGMRQSDGSQVPFCIDCTMKMQGMAAQRVRNSAAVVNFLMDRMDDMAGHPRTGGRVQMPVDPIVRTGGITLNSISVSNSNIGVLNTGQIETIDSAVGFLSSGGNTGIADALKSMAEAVIKSAEATLDQKNQLLELLSLISTEAANPPEKRRAAGIRPTILAVASVLSGLNALSTLWAKLAPAIVEFFSKT